MQAVNEAETPVVLRRKLFTRRALLTIYRRLLSAYGPQHWWPADTPFEVMIGAVLTQNTAWTNVEKAIAGLKRARCLSAAAILRLHQARLAELIRPSGYFNVKARRLKNFCEWYKSAGGLRTMRRADTASLRRALLKVNGIGPETADDILLYAVERPVFVIDVYTRRLFRRLGLIAGDEPYEVLRSRIETLLGPDVPLFKEYHALIVRHAKEKCAGREGCRHCQVEAPLNLKR